MQNLNSNYLSTRIKFIRDAMFMMSQSDFATKSGLTQRDISQIESGKKKFLPVELIQFLNKEGVDLNLLFNESSDFVKVAAKIAANVAANSKLAPNLAPIVAPINQISFVPKVLTIDQYNRELVPLVPLKAAAGYLNGYGDPEYIETLPTLDLPGLSGGTHRAFEVRGMSMMPTHHPGSIAIGRWVESIDDIRNRRVYILLTKYDGVVMKRVLNYVGSEGKLILMSDNDNKSEYPNYPLDPAEILEIWYWRGGVIREIPEPGNVYNRINNLEARLSMVESRIR